MHKAVIRLILAIFVLGIINPWAGRAVPANTDLHDYFQTCANKQEQVLPLVKNVQVKVNIASQDYCFTKPFWAGSTTGYPAADYCYAVLPKYSQNIHNQQYLQLLLYPPHFFG